MAYEECVSVPDYNGNLRGNIDSTKVDHTPIVTFRPDLNWKENVSPNRQSSTIPTEEIVVNEWNETQLLIQGFQFVEMHDATEVGLLLEVELNDMDSWISDSDFVNATNDSLGQEQKNDFIPNPTTAGGKHMSMPSTQSEQSGPEPVSMSVTDSRKLNDKKKFTCNECGDKFRTNRSVLAHCRQFFRAQGLFPYSHPKSRHPVFGYVVCKMCGTTFRSYEAIVAHQTNCRNTKQGSSECAECGAFVKGMYWHMHRRHRKKIQLPHIATLYNERLMKFECNKCGALMRTSTLLNDHLNKTECTASATYCNKCGLFFERCKGFGRRFFNVHWQNHCPNVRYSNAAMKRLYSSLNIKFPGKDLNKAEATRQAQIEQQRKMNLQELRRFGMKIMKGDMLVEKTFGVVLVLVTQMLLRVKGQKENVGISNLRKEHFQVINGTTFVVTCIYAGMQYRMQFVERIEFVSTLKTILRLNDADTCIFECVRGALKHYLMEKHHLLLSALRRTSITKQLIAIFESLMATSKSFEECVLKCKERLACLTHHMRYEKITTKTNDKYYLDEEGYLDVCRNMWDGSSSAFYPGKHRCTSTISLTTLQEKTKSSLKDFPNKDGKFDFVLLKIYST